MYLLRALDNGAEAGIVLLQIPYSEPVFEDFLDAVKNPEKHIAACCFITCQAYAEFC